MKTKNKFCLILFLLVLFLFSKTSASESENFLSLKNDEVNLRQGPSFKYPIRLIYKKKYLPVEILDRFETWRKIKDFENNTGWIHTSQLSKKKTALNIEENSLLFKKPTVYSKPLAKLKVGRLVLIQKCKEKWCKITSGKFTGWIFKKSLWGKFK